MVESPENVTCEFAGPCARSGELGGWGTGTGTGTEPSHQEVDLCKQDCYEFI